MRIAIEVAGFSPADSDGFRRAMGTWRSSREMEKLHSQFVDGCLRQPGMDRADGRGAVPPGRRVRELRVRQEPRRRVRPDRLRVVVPQAVLPGPVRRRAHQRPADGLLPGRGARQRRQAPRRGGPAGRHQRERLPDDDRMGRPAGSRSGGPGSRRPEPVRSPACVVPSAAARERWAAESASAGASGSGCGSSRGSARSTRSGSTGARPRAVPDPGRRRRADRAAGGGPRAARSGSAALDSLGRPRRELLWQLREVAGATRAVEAGDRAGRSAGPPARPMDLRLPATDGPADLPRDHRDRSGSAMPTRSSGSMPGARSSGCSGRRSTGSGR